MLTMPGIRRNQGLWPHQLPDRRDQGWKITYMRPGESATCPDGDVCGVLTWTISEAVTAINGTGSVVIEAYRGGEMLKHSGPHHDHHRR